jgi:hypothetical protein
MLTEKLKLIFSEDKQHGFCDVCKVPTTSFQNTVNDFKRLIIKKPLNNQHKNSYRRGFEFITTDNLWKKVMKKNTSKYICLECFEREYLTPFLQNNKTDRKPNKYGFFEVISTDLNLANTVNNNAVDFFKTIESVDKKPNNKPLY